MLLHAELIGKTKFIQIHWQKQKLEARDPQKENKQLGFSPWDKSQRSNQRT